MNFIELFKTLRSSWDARSAYSSNDWTAENPARGQCAVSSLIVQDYFGGEIMRYQATHPSGKTEKHYANLIEGTLVDTTRSQFPPSTKLEESPPDLGQFKTMRERMLSDPDTARRYEYLKSKVKLASIK